MSLPEKTEVEEYFYRSTATSNRHRNRVSAYFVQRMRGSNVVARIEPLGLVPTSIGDEQLAIQRLRRNLVVAGTWQATASGRPFPITCRAGAGRHDAEGRPTELVRSPWGDLLVVETGVDPVTSRFSGARSTD